jgi:hypothetical protein
MGWSDCWGDCSCDDAGGKVDVAAGSAEYTAFVMGITFILSGTAPLTPIQFDLSFHDLLDHEWTDSFEIPVVS